MSVWRRFAPVVGVAAVPVFDYRRRRLASCHNKPGVQHGDHSHSHMPERYHHQHDTANGGEHLLFAVPKKGRLSAPVKKLLAGAGIEYVRKERLDIAHSSNLPISLIFLPSADIAKYVGEGSVDLGITGEDVIAESEVLVDTLVKLGVGKCRLSVQAPEDSADALDVKRLAGKRIVTQFPHTSRDFFKQYEVGTPTQVKAVSGSVEAACRLGLADAIVDPVDTGTTMRAAGLKEVAVVLKSEAVLIANPNSEHKELIETIRKRIAGYLLAQSWLMVTYKVQRSDLAVALKITPGKRSPAIAPLESPDEVRVQALVPKKDAALVMDKLQRVGVTEILLTAILSSRMGH